MGFRSAKIEVYNNNALYGFDIFENASFEMSINIRGQLALMNEINPNDNLEGWYTLSLDSTSGFRRNLFDSISFFE